MTRPPLCIVPNAWLPGEGACGPAACGNGALDTCASWCGSIGTEACDGTQLGGRSCQDLGYSGGTLKCSAQCSFDTSACTRCAPTDDVLRACGNAPVDARAPTALAIDANDQEIGLAWTSLDTTGNLGLHFARFAPDLTLISERGPFGPSCPGSIGLVARPGGWTLAVFSGGGARVLALDASGATTSDIEVPLGPSGASPMATKMAFARRDGGGALLAWAGSGTGTSGGATLVSATGASIGDVQELDVLRRPAQALAVTATAGGWLVAYDFDVMFPAGELMIETFEVNVDGSRITGNGHYNGQYNSNPRLVGDGTNLRMSFNTPGMQSDAFEGSGLYFVDMMHEGGYAKTPVVVGASGSGYKSAAPMVVVRGATSVFTAFGAGDRPNALHYQQYHANGSPVYGMPRVIATDADAIKTYVTARRGFDAIVAWINGAPGAGTGPSNIGIARVSPVTTPDSGVQ